MVAVFVPLARTPVVDNQFAELHRRRNEHPLWNSPLLAGFAQGTFTRDDLQYIFSQYRYYTQSFTRFIAAVMANCDNDLFRAQLSENLWDEGGGCDPDRRHAQIFRNFLHQSLGIDRFEDVDCALYTKHFVREYLATCLQSGPLAGAAFLSLGTESIVARLYEIMLAGLRSAGIPEHELEFFHIHIACDDDHAKTLENMMASYADEPGWFDTSLAAMTRALDLRAEFFANIFAALQHRRVAAIASRMQGRESLASDLSDTAIHHRPGDTTEALYANQVDKLNIEFTVERLPLSAEILDPRMVRIPAGKYNEKHKHAHETLIHILDGSGQVVVDGRAFSVAPGDTVLVPRWAMHQTQNLGATEMRFLAVTDFRFTQRAYLGDATDYRHHADAECPCGTDA